MSAVDKFLRSQFKGVSWQNNYLKPIIRTLDIPDWMLCQLNGRGHLPRYSVRVRSDGVTKQLGGQRFDYFGEFTAQTIFDLAELTPQSKVLEIGCGAGRTALALTKRLNEGNYTGVDIDAVSIASCQRNRRFQENHFTFKHINVQNMMYNPEGKEASTTYKFPFKDESVDAIFMISVFTHMLPAEVTHYISEISRMLTPGGKCVLSTFVMDYGTDGQIVSFPFNKGDYHLHVENIPEKAVGYYKKFFTDSFANQNMRLFKQSLGDWRAFEIEAPITEFGQDFLVFTK